MSDSTATAPPTGDRSPDLIATSVALSVFSSVFVAARLWTRTFRTKAFGWDDGFIIVAWVGTLLAQAAEHAMLTARQAAAIATTAMNISSAVNGYGKPIMAIPPAKIPEALKYSNFGILTNGVAMGTMKMSIGFSMLRIQLAKPFTIVVWMTMVLSVLVNLNVLVGCFKSCTPMERIWNLAVPGTCWPTEVNVTLAYLQSSKFPFLKDARSASNMAKAGNIVTDLLLTFGLLICLTKLKLSTYNKWALRGVFLIGLV